MKFLGVLCDIMLFWANILLYFSYDREEDAIHILKQESLRLIEKYKKIRITYFLHILLFPSLFPSLLKADCRNSVGNVLASD